MFRLRRHQRMGEQPFPVEFFTPLDRNIRDMGFSEPLDIAESEPTSVIPKQIPAALNVAEEDVLSVLTEPLNLSVYSPNDRPPFIIHPIKIPPVHRKLFDNDDDVIPGLSEPLDIDRRQERRFVVYQPKKRKPVREEDIIPGLSEPLDIDLNKRAKTRAAMIHDYIHSAMDRGDRSPDLGFLDMNIPLDQIPQTPPDAQVRGDNDSSPNEDPFIEEYHTLGDKIDIEDSMGNFDANRVVSNLIPGELFPYEFGASSILPNSISIITTNANLLWHLIRKYKIWNDIDININRLTSRMMFISEHINNIKLYRHNAVADPDTRYVHHTIQTIIRDSLIEHILTSFVSVESALRMRSITMITNDKFEELYHMTKFIDLYINFFNPPELVDTSPTGQIWMHDDVAMDETHGFSVVLTPRTRFYFSTFLALFPVWIPALLNVIRRFEQVDIFLLQARIGAVEYDIENLKMQIGGNDIILSDLDPFYRNMYTLKPGEPSVVPHAISAESFAQLRGQAEALADEYLKALIAYDSYVVFLTNGQNILYALEHIPIFREKMYVLNALFDKTQYHTREESTAHINDSLRVLAEENADELTLYAQVVIKKQMLYHSFRLAMAHYLEREPRVFPFFGTGSDWATNGVLIKPTHGVRGSSLVIKTKIDVLIINAMGQYLETMIGLLSSQWIGIKSMIVVIAPRLQRITADDLNYIRTNNVILRYERPVFIEFAPSQEEPRQQQPVVLTTSSTEKKDPPLVEKGEAHANKIVTKTTVKKVIPSLSAKRRIFYKMNQ